MSTLNRLRISGIRSFDPDEQQDVNFQTPVTLFLGQNGCGKTSIIESVKYAITGDLPLGTKSGQGFIHDPQMCHKVESRAQVKLEIYDVKQKPLTVQRVAKVSQIPTGLKFASMNATLTRDNESTTNRCIDVNNEVCRSMGVSKSILNDVIFCHQEDSFWPLEESKKLKERFDRIFDSAKYNYCVDRVLKLKKILQDKLKLLVIEVDIKKRNKIQMEKKKEQLLEKRTRKSDMEDRIREIGDDVVPIKNKREKIITLEREFTKIETKLENLKAQIEHNQQQQTEILSTIKELDWSDEELQNRIDTFQSDTDQSQAEIDQLESKRKKIDHQEEKTRKEINDKQLTLGQLQAEFKQHQKRIKDQQTLITTLHTDFDIMTPSSMEVTDQIKIYNTKLGEIEDEITAFEKKTDETERELQDSIDEYRTKCAQLEQEIATKNKHLDELRNEHKSVTRKLNDLDTCDDQIKEIETRLVKTDEDLKRVECQVNVPELREEIEHGKNKYESLEDQLQKLEKEIKTLQNYSSIQTEVDLHQDNLQKKQKDKRDFYYKHESNFETIFNYDIPENDLKSGLEKILKEQTQVIRKMENTINDKEKEVHKLEASLNSQKEKLKQARTDLKNNKMAVDEVFGDVPFEQAEEAIKKKIDELQTQKGEFINSIQMYRKFIQSFKKEKPCCPVCNRDVQQKNETDQIIEEIEKKIGDFPKLAKETEAKLNNMLAKHAKMLELKSTYFEVEKMEKNDVPLLRQSILDQEKTFDDLQKVLENLKNDALKPKKLQELINSIITDAALIDQYNIEIKKLQNEISNLKSKMPSTQTSRNIEDAYYEQDNLKTSAKETRQKMESLTNKLNKHLERLQQIKEERHKLKAKELNMKQDLQTKEHLEIKKKETDTKIKELVVDVQDATKQINPLKESLEKAIKARETSKRVHKAKRDQLTNIHKCFDKILQEIKDYQTQIEVINKKNLPNKIEDISSTLEEFNNNLEAYSKQKESILKQIEGLKDQIVNKKGFYRELLDNKRLREKRIELVALNAEKNELKSKISDNDLHKLLEARQNLDSKLIEFNQELMKLKGSITELDKSIAEVKKELQDPMYANAASDFKNKFIEWKVMERTVKDLDVFVKAFDWSIIQYHKQQMVYINETIRDLWRTIYRGNDIDYIEIKTEMENSRNNDKRRIYQYRLVQVKNDVEIEMRGRCSAGQKVLASLVIRIALADTFSTKCGILALDEPTTNLDKENIASLCDALCELINRKRNQKSFQLLVITHDQEFLEKLSRAVLIENYIHVTRNEYGKSVVSLKPTNY